MDRLLLQNLLGALPLTLSHFQRQPKLEKFGVLEVSVEHLVRGQTAQRAVRSEGVVIILECLDLFLRIVEREEPIHVQTLIPKAAVE